MPIAPYAVSEQNSRGRVHAVAPSTDRNEFQRDYTRILHSEAFRRLQYKTQVFASHEGDFFRTRLTHSLEVEQFSRSVAGRLNLNVDLAGTLAIGHDLGHAPFGHLGQDVLNELMKDHGGFEHNFQALRIIDKIESPYPHQVGLNLMFETREGLLKHCSVRNAHALGEVAERHLSKTMAPLEVEVVDHCDAIAYLHADLEDAFTMGLLSPELLRQAPGYEQAWKNVQVDFPGVAHPTTADLQSGDRDRMHNGETMIKTVIREMLRMAISDLTVTSAMNLERVNPQSLDDVRHAGEIIAFSPASNQQHLDLKKYSRLNIYQHPQVMDAREIHEVALRGLFKAYEKDPSEMSGKGVDPTEDFHRSLADHISGMTDRYALSEYQRILKNRPELLADRDVSMDVEAPRPARMRMR